jgi:hypothetical protein
MKYKITIFTTIALLLISVFAIQSSKAESNLSIGLSCNTENFVLKVNEELSFQIIYEDLDTQLYSIDFNILYDPNIFSISSSPLKPSNPNMSITYTQEELDSSLVLLQVQAISYFPITDESGSICQLFLTSKVKAKNAKVELQVINCVIEEEQYSSFIKPQYINREITFIKGSKPLWFILGIPFSIIIGLVIGYFGYIKKQVKNTKPHDSSHTFVNRGLRKNNENKKEFK